MHMAEDNVNKAAEGMEALAGGAAQDVQAAGTQDAQDAQDVGERAAQAAQEAGATGAQEAGAQEDPGKRGKKAKAGQPDGKLGGKPGDKPGRPPAPKIAKDAPGRHKNVKYGVSAVVTTVVVVVAAVVLNILVGMLDFKFDLTANKMYSIGDVTQDLLAGLTQDVEIIGMFDETTTSTAELTDVVKLLENYKKSPHVTVRYIDPDKNPAEVRALDPDDVLDIQASDFVVRNVADGKTRKIASSDLYEMEANYQTFSYDITGSAAESKISGAILYVTSDVASKAYFVTGHDEDDLSLGYTYLTTVLTNNKFDYASTDLKSEDGIPSDAKVLVFVSPKQDLLPAELDRLNDFLAAGGNAIFLFDFDDAGTELANFNAALEAYNLRVNGDRVSTSQAIVPGDPYFIYPTGDANEVVSSALGVVMRDARTVSVLSNDKVTVSTITMLETDAASSAEPMSAGGEYAVGPLEVAVAAESTGGAQVSRVLLVGNAVFLSDAMAEYIGQNWQSGAQMFLLTMRWMIGDEDGLYIPTKPAQEYVTIDITEQQVPFVMAGVAGFVLLIIAAGVAVYLHRRHL
jgi:hypothetical protein